MGRPEQIIDPNAGPLQAFAWDLRQLRIAAGRPRYRELAQRSGYSASALSAAASGAALPSLPVAIAYVKACGGETAVWEDRWHRLRTVLTSTREMTTGHPRTDATTPVEPNGASRSARSWWGGPAGSPLRSTPDRQAATSPPRSPPRPPNALWYRWSEPGPRPTSVVRGSGSEPTIAAYLDGMLLAGLKPGPVPFGAVVEHLCADADVAFDFTAATVREALDRLRRIGLVDGLPGGAPAPSGSYRLTAAGETALQQQQTAWLNFSAAVTALLCHNIIEPTHFSARQRE